jgi:hypothetical protein
MATGRFAVICSAVCSATAATFTALCGWVGSAWQDGTTITADFRHGCVNLIITILALPWAFIAPVWAVAFPPIRPVAWGSLAVAEASAASRLKARARSFRQRIAERVKAKDAAPLFGGLAGAAAGCI